jgi:hypothetical protein
MRVFDRTNFPHHSRWAISTVLEFFALFLVYFACGELLDGGTAAGLLFGSIATLMIVLEACYALRRRSGLDHQWVDRLPGPVRMLLCLTKSLVNNSWMMFRRWFDREPTHIRLKRHIWIGLMSVPVVYLHCGPRWGSAISSAVFVLFIIVIASGVFGLLLQQGLPRLLRLEVSDEVIYSQIPAVLDDLRWESELLIRATCGPVDFGDEPGGEVALFTARRPSPLLTAIRDHRRGRGAGFLAHVPRAPVTGSECLLEFYEKELLPFLAGAPLPLWRALYLRVARLLLGGDQGVLDSPTLAKTEFLKLRGGIDPSAHGVVDALERICERRRQLACQSRLHAVLHLWRLIHLPATAALLVTLAAHIYYGMKFLMIIRLLPLR